MPLPLIEGDQDGRIVSGEYFPYGFKAARQAARDADSAASPALPLALTPIQRQPQLTRAARKQVVAEGPITRPPIRAGSATLTSSSSAAEDIAARRTRPSLSVDATQARLRADDQLIVGEGAVMEPPRSLQRRKQDTLGRLESDADAFASLPEGHNDPGLPGDRTPAVCNRLNT